MGLHLIFASSDPSWGMFALLCFVVLIGVNLIILAHEWGHFIVARMCGVKCEKFYIWFDVFGWRICRFKWGETEYGLGVLPLGGYVKMLGQEDNPARLREELERAKAARSAGDSPEGNPDGAAGSCDEIDVEAAERALYDPRSYLAQSVPKRMAIISAGVIMNVLFALAAGIVAYQFGVREIACGVGAVVAGTGAWQVDMKVGDQIEQIGDRPTYRFTDLKAAVSLEYEDEEVPMVVRRPGVEEPFTVTPISRQGALSQQVGIAPPSTTTLATFPAFPGTPAAEAAPAFQSGDKIIGIDGQPVEHSGDLHILLARKPDRPMKVTVERTSGPTEGDPEAAAVTEEVTIEMAPGPMRHFGLVMEMGPIEAIQDNSPAAGSPLKPDDKIVSVNGRAVDDPMRLPDLLRRQAEEGEDPRVTLKIARKGQSEPLTIEVPLRKVEAFDTVSSEGMVSAPALGIAYRVGNRVRRVLPGSPAAEQGLRAGDVLVRARVIPPDREWVRSQGLEKISRKLRLLKKETFVLKEGKTGWPLVFFLVQQSLPGTRVELELEGDRSVTLTPVEAAEWFNPERGFLFEVQDVRRKAESFGEAVALGYEETVDSLLVIFRTLKALATGRVSPKSFIGPVGIVEVAYYRAAEGPGEFLQFLCLISANLAVINFLPIPLLDGGHMIFLAYEGIRGKPPSERVFVALSYLGLAFILLLMIWVVSLDIGCIPRH